MIELIIKEKAKRFDEALIIARKNYIAAQDLSANSKIGVECFKNTLEHIFPELQESEDEKIRKDLLTFLDEVFYFGKDANFDKWGKADCADWKAWLEKQSNTIPDECVFRPVAGCDIESAAKQAIKQQGILAKEVVLAFNGAYIPVKGKTQDIIVDEYNSWLEKQGEPKFKVGEWITNGEYTWKVVEVMPLDYTLQSQDGSIVDDTISYVDKHFHLWTIQDAKDGDILATDKSVFIYSKVLHNKPYAYCGIDKFGVLKVNCLENNWANGIDNIYPATKEQRDTLMKAMVDAGYTFDFGKKELKKIEKEPNPDDIIEESYQQQADDLIDVFTEKSVCSKEDEDLFDFLHTCVCHGIYDPYWAYGKRVKASKELIPFIERLKALYYNEKLREDSAKIEPKFGNNAALDMSENYKS